MGEDFTYKDDPFAPESSFDHYFNKSKNSEMEIYGYAIQIRCDLKEDSGLWSEGPWTRYFNHKVYPTLFIAEQAVKNLSKDIKSDEHAKFEFRIVPLYWNKK